MASLANHPANRDQAKVMNRYDITKRMVGLLRQDEAVIGGIGYTNFDLWAASETPHGRRQQNFYMLGSMGLAVPIALGVALAQPGRRVIALEGDGSLLMQLGALGTIATLAPQNLAIIVMDYASYQITGAQKTATAFKTDLPAMARGAGLAQSQWAADEQDYEQLVARALNEPGPWLIAAWIDQEPGVGTTDRASARIRDRF